MKPYYEHAGITIYHGDCRDVMPHVDADAVVTDPPYGIGFGYASYDDTRDAWYRLMDDTVPVMRAKARFVAMPACDRYSMAWWYTNHAPDWMVCWYKGSPGHRSPIGFNDWEPILVWGVPPKPMHDHFQTPCGFDDNGHPCPKPIEWASWLVARACDEGGTILDPFMGSGTTLVSAKNLGRSAIGIEIEERYCEIAAKRLAQEVMNL